MFARLTNPIQAFSRDVKLYLTTALLLGLSVDGVYAVLFNLYLVRLGYDAKFIGFINSAGLFAFAFSSLPAGILGSRWGTRRLLVLGISTILIGSALVPMSHLAPTSWQDYWIAGSYILMMGGFSTFFVNGSPFMMGSVEKGQRNSLFAMHTAISSFAAFLGSLLGGQLPGIYSGFANLTLESPIPYRVPMQVMVVLMVPAFFFIRATHEPKHQDNEDDAEDEPAEPRTRLVNFKKLPLLLFVIIAIIRLLQVAGLATTSTFINVYLDTELMIETSLIGVLIAFSRGLAAASALLVPMLTKRFGNISVALFGSIGAAFCILPIVFIPTWWAAGLGFIGARIMSSLRYPSFQVYALELVRPRQQSVMAGLMALAAGASFSIMAFFGGFIIESFSFSTLFMIGAVLTTIGTGVLAAFHVALLRGFAGFSVAPTNTVANTD